MKTRVSLRWCITATITAQPLARQGGDLTSIIQGLGSSDDFTSALSGFDDLNASGDKPSADQISALVGQLTSAFQSTNQEISAQDTDAQGVDPEGLGRYLAEDIQGIVDHLSPTLDSVVGEDLGLPSILQPLDDEITSTLSGLQSDVTNIQQILYGALNDLGLGDVATLLDKTLNGELPALLTSIDNELNGVLEGVPVVGDLLLSLGL